MGILKYWHFSGRGTAFAKVASDGKGSRRFESSCGSLTNIEFPETTVFDQSWSRFSAMRVESVMVTGANRGIGLEFVRQLSGLSEPPKYIFATYRNPDSLKDLKGLEESSTKTKIILIKMDVTNPEERESARNAVEETVKERGLNLLINNAGVSESQLFPNLTPENLELHFRVNTLAPIMVFQTMLPLLERAADLHSDSDALCASRAAVLNMASLTGSITNAGVIFRRDLVVPAYKISKDLKEIEESSTKSKFILIKMDVTHPEEIEVAKTIVEDTVGERGLNLLINNAGVAKMEMFPNVTPENLELHYKVNTEGPLLVLQAMLPSLERAAQLHAGTGGMRASRAAVLNMTSMAGSITNAGFVFTQDLAVPSYKISKAALNMAMRVAAANTKDKGILIVMMCPGWVKTDMGGRDQAVLEPEESIGNMLKTLFTLDESHHGTYMDRLGTPYPF